MKAIVIAITVVLLGTFLEVSSTRPAFRGANVGSCSTDSTFIERVRDRAVDLASSVDAPHVQMDRDTLQIPHVDANQVSREVTESLCARAGALMNHDVGLPPGTPRSVVLFRIGPRVWGEDPGMEFRGHQAVFVFDSLITTLLVTRLL